jgi:hypothetical protein
MQESQQQAQAEQQATQQPSIEQSPAPERKYLHYTIYDRDKSALEGLGSRIMQWGREKSENIKSKLHNFFLGADLDTLADQIVAMATRKQYIGAAQKPQLKELIMSAAKDGFKDVTSKMQQTPTEESEKPPAQPEQQPAQAKQKQFPKPPTAAEAQASSEGLQKDPGILQMFETFKAQRPDLDDAKLFEIILDAAVKIKGSK